MASTPVFAAPGIVDSQVQPIKKTNDPENVGFSSGSIVAAPIPFSNPTIGSGLIVGAGYLFNTDSTSKPSVIGVGALASDNSSTAYAFSVNLAFDNNRWLFKSFFGNADIRYDLFTDIAVLPIRQEGFLGRASLAYGVTPELSFGASLRYLDTKVFLDNPELPPLPPPYDQYTQAEIGNIGIIADWDRRDDTIYPTDGSYLQFEASRGIAMDNVGQDYSKGFLNYTHYQSLGDKSVLVGRISTCAASEESPFFDQCSLGATDKFRGFSVTQFLDLRSVSMQVEYRHQFSNRLGGVLFAGLGAVGSDYSDINLGSPNGAVGIGARYRVSKKFPLDFSIDTAHNDLGENTLYIYVGQRF